MATQRLYPQRKSLRGSTDLEDVGGLWRYAFSMRYLPSPVGRTEQAIGANVDGKNTPTVFVTRIIRRVESRDKKCSVGH